MVRLMPPAYVKLSDTTTGWLVSPEYPPAKITPGEETSEPSAKDGALGTKTADTPFGKKDKPAQKPHRLRTAKALNKPAATARAAVVKRPNRYRCLLRLSRCNMHGRPHRQPELFHAKPPA